MDTESLLKSLQGHRVRFVIIGATSFPIHGYSRATLDVDIFIRPERPNAERVLAALNNLIKMKQAAGRRKTLRI